MTKHPDDAAAMLVATDLALRYPDRVRALVVLERDAPHERAPATAERWEARADRPRELTAQAGVDAVAEALISEY